MKIDGKKVRDAKYGKLVEVTPVHVRRGARKDSQSCAAAIALEENVCERARVGVQRTYLLKRGEWYRYQTPESLRREVIAFDRGGEFAPGTYKLEPIKESQTSAARRRYKDTAKGASAKSKGIRTQHVTAGIRPRFTSHDM